MCGRYASARSVDDIAGAFGIRDDDVDASPAPDWNIAPTTTVTAVVHAGDRPVLTSLRWGLVPSWSDGPQAMTSLFNARAETIAEKPAFRDAVRRRRCLLPADGWYEWARSPDGHRVPHFLSGADGSLLAFAAVWEEWLDAERRPLRSAAIVTRPAPDALRQVHDRAPVVLPPAAWTRWLDPATPVEHALAVLRADPPQIRLWPVGDAVGDVRARGSALAEPVTVAVQPSLF
jgi:putative SOS response-associated peptidase YedK